MQESPESLRRFTLSPPTTDSPIRFRALSAPVRHRGEWISKRSHSFTERPCIFKVPRAHRSNTSSRGVPVGRKQSGGERTAGVLPGRSWAGNRIYLICALTTWRVSCRWMQANRNEESALDIRRPGHHAPQTPATRRSIDADEWSGHINAEHQPCFGTDLARLLGCVVAIS